MVLGNIIYATLRWGPPLVIPFNAHDKIEPHFGWCFYLSLLTGKVRCLDQYTSVQIMCVFNTRAKDLKEVLYGSVLDCISLGF